jgi:hypothetical protein
MNIAAAAHWRMDWRTTPESGLIKRHTPVWNVKPHDRDERRFTHLRGGQIDVCGLVAPSQPSQEVSLFTGSGNFP